MARLYIGLCGKPLAGKGTFAEEFSRIARDCGLTFSHVRFSDILREIAGLLSLEKSRANLQKLAQVVDGSFGKGTLSNAVLARLMKQGVDIVLVDGVRWLTDESMIWELSNHRRVYMVYIDSSVKDRWGRSKKRGENAGEREKSFEQFLFEDSAENERWIDSIGIRADLRIENPGTTPEDELRYRECIRIEVRKLIGDVEREN